ncbi:activated protein kinase catalytic subunit alpha-1 [Seminavis robusta]|uniref:guanylate cyclase n=1 Tax=Seminavis robusta TaxID=568900 RepID=A0A9N8EL43_9STRA|nr:activated protein kinase catalytic subunit alpha-1 [Seminavis robusta]|eukprot:Sro1331_g263490.1 activated protein kinase catalytic subunit alpha-1 (1607) ;mRNA; r:6628-12610
MKSRMALTILNFTFPVAAQPTPAPFAPCDLLPLPASLLPSQSRIYRVAVLAFRGVDTAQEQWSLLFGDYLTATAGKRFDPPVSFEMVPVPFGLEREPVDEFIQGGYDFVYANPSMFSCVDSEVGMNTLVSVISKRKVNGQVYSLTEFGGVIFTWAGNDQINKVEDLAEKRLGLANIAGLGSGQMQFREMIKNGLHHLQDPKQLIFYGNQNKVVQAVLNGDVDIGFVRTDQLERFIDPATNEPLDQSKIKIVGPQQNLLADGSPFPFAASTQDLYPEWALASFPSVGKDIEREVQHSLMDLTLHAAAAKPLVECYEDRNCTSLLLDDDNRATCQQECFRQAHPWGHQTCEADADTTLLADLAQTAGNFAGWRTPLSYMSIRNMQQEIGFIQHRQDGTFQCLRGDSLADSVVCPLEHFKKSVDEIATGCEDLGMPCYGFSCMCKPCVKSYDVDVFPLMMMPASTNSTNQQQVGCGKFDVCGVVQQNHKRTFRAVDNRKRHNTSFAVLLHAGGDSQEYHMKQNDTYAYEFEFDATDSKVGYLIMEISVLEDGEWKQVSQSPFRLEVVPPDCQAETGDSGRVADANGNCICDNSTIELPSGCMPLGVFIPAVMVPIILAAAAGMFCYLWRKRQQEDLVWQIASKELCFDSPPNVLGRGRFGMVYLGTFRGTEVAVKKLLDPDQVDQTAHRSMGVREVGKLISLAGVKTGDVETFPDEDASQTEHEGKVGIRSCLFIPPQSSHGSGKMNTTLGSSRKQQASLKSEMRLLSKLRHPNVVTIMGCTQDMRLVMEYMELGSMSDVLRSPTMVVDDGKVLGMVQDVAKGLRFLHATNIIHGDLKAQNVLVDAKFRAKVADFGLSKHPRRRRGKGASGTPFWMAPELLRGTSGNTTMSDIYSFGVFLFEAYKRQYPYQGEDPNEVLRKIIDPLVNKCPSIPSRCPMQVAGLMEACFEEPEGRPTASEIDEKLASITQDGGRGQALLWELFPRHVAAAIRDGRTVEPETHENVSVLVSNIVGHETLESTLSPTKHSNLLDRLYSKLENLCDLHNVFRLVTGDDGFMCATNLAEEQHDHVRSIAAFATDALKAAACTLVDEGDPSKGYVSIRIGISSGTVVSHVVGSRTPRYSIFGQPVNIATKLESSAVPGRAQCSEVSADLLKEQDPEADLFLHGTVPIDGGNEIVSYWIGEPIVPGSEPVAAAPESGVSNKGLGSLIEWNVDVLARVLREIVAARHTHHGNTTQTDFSHLAAASEAGTIIDEVEEVVSLPKFNVDTVRRMKERQGAALPPDVMLQLRAFVTEIAQMYDNDVPFHNFQHASHVTLSVVRLLTRIKAVPMEGQGATNRDNEEQSNMSLHECSFGIASDPVTQLAIIFSALIHDTAHQGVPNTQLVKENQEIAARYKGRSVAEQNSVALAWNLFMNPKFSELRHTIAQTEDEITRFRQLVINCVMATDIVDKALKQLRNNRWDTAFSGQIAEEEEKAVNRKATIVIEHIIQASDIGHTMQQWHVYRKWNERFFQECYKAYKEGRAEKDPSKGWYKGEIGFFDFYIIPLAKKLQESGVFGVYGDEYVKNAQANREEWVKCGEHALAEMMEKQNKGRQGGGTGSVSMKRV